MSSLRDFHGESVRTAIAAGSYVRVAIAWYFFQSVGLGTVYCVNSTVDAMPPKVYPSGAEFSISRAPMTPAAPGLLNTTMLRPSCASTRRAAALWTTSVPSPAGHGTTSDIGLLG